MNDDLRQRVTNIFERIEGGCTKDMEQMLDEAIEDGEITQEEYGANEMDIAYLFDARWFQCVQCGWTMPIECQSANEDNVEAECSDCSPEEDDD